MTASLKLNALFPTRDIGNDPVKIRDWAQAAEDLGYSYIEVPDHVFGVSERDGWIPLYNETDPFHETFCTLSFLAATTKRIKLSSGVLILPQRQTGLVAKQASEVDILSGGRLRLGIGVGWNHVEYDALGVEWNTRGPRQAEQVEVLRKLWTERLVTYSGRFHNLRDVSLVPQPVQRPIPIWFGGSSDTVIKRAAQIGDGWMPIIDPDSITERKIADLRQHLEKYNRNFETFGLEGWLRTDKYDPEKWGSTADGWRYLGAQMIMLYPMYRIPTFKQQIQTLERFSDVIRN